MSGVTLYKRDGQFLLYPLHKTVKGLRIAGTPVYSLGVSSLDGLELAIAVKKALGESRNDVPSPSKEEAQKLAKPLLDVARVKNWAAFIKGSVCVEIRCDGDIATLIPTRNSGAREGFKHQTDQAIKTQLEVGLLSEALKNALVLAE